MVHLKFSRIPEFENSWADKDSNSSDADRKPINQVTQRKKFIFFNFCVANDDEKVVSYFASSRNYVKLDYQVYSGKANSDQCPCLPSEGKN